MSRLKAGVLVFALALASLGQTGSSPLTNPEVRRIGEMLLCLCGCGSTITSCNMQHCHFSDPARVKLLSMVNSGMSQQAILDSFVKEYGLRILVKPPAEGFNLLGWVMPPIALALGLVIVWLVIQRLRRPAPAAATVPPVDDAVLEQYRERIEKDLDKLD